MKTLWGFDPFQQTGRATERMYHLLKQLAGNSKDIEIGYVATGSETELNTAFDVPLKERFLSYPQNLIRDKLLGAKIAMDRNKIHVIFHQTFSVTAAVDRFLALGRKQKTELVALFTHGKKGVSRLFMGSFAETAIHRSKMNLLVINPKSEVRSDLKHILFASDFSPRSKKDLLQVLKLCQRIGAKLTVFHAAQIIYDWSLNDSDPSIQAYRRKTKQIADWIEKTGTEAGVPCSVVIDSNLRLVSDLIFKWAKKENVDLIVVCAKVGPLAALMGGSVTRQVVRNGTFPVLVLKR